MAIILTKPEFESLPEVDQWAIVYNLHPQLEAKPEPKPEPEPPPKRPVVDGWWA